jgi:hypothetical protein
MMERDAMTDHILYEPINTLKPVADNVWIVDGPAIEFGFGRRWPKMRFPTRMTIVRLPDEQLFIHSPTSMTAGLKAEIARLGHPRWIIAPNRLHHWWIPDWRQEFARASVYLAPRVRQQAGDRICFDALTLDRDEGYPWDVQIATVCVVSRYMTEVEFFHRPSRTLILADLIENFEPSKLDGMLSRWLTRLGGVQHPDGQMPREMRLTFSRGGMHLRAAVEKMISWAPERIILAHGRWYPKDGAAELRRAFRWLLKHSAHEGYRPPA